MHCPKCGEQMNPTAATCPTCGADVTASSSGESHERGADLPPDPTLPGRQGPKRRREGRRGGKTLALSLAALGGVFFFQIIGALASFILPLDAEMVVYVFGTLGAILGMVGLGGAQALVPTCATMRFAFRQGWWVVLLSVCLCAFDLVTCMVVEGMPPVDDWPQRVMSVLILCLLIGILEETMFRGLLLGGMLDAFGSTKHAIMVIALCTSAGFGIAHVNWIELDYANSLDLVQALLKTIQTGIFGFFLTAIVMSSHNVAGASLLHGLNDFLLMFPAVGLLGESTEIDYVTTGEDVWPTIILYLVIIALYLPLLVRGIRLLRNVEAPAYGPFHKGA